MASSNDNKDNNTGKRRDPLPTFCFLVDLKIGDAAEQAFFKSVSGLSYEAEVVEVREGGVNDTTFKLVGPMKWKNLVFKQGFVALKPQQPSSLLNWREQWMTGEKMVRSTGKITMLDTALTEMATWTFFRRCVQERARDRDPRDRPRRPEVPEVMRWRARPNLVR
jgi:phage tail-like protein